MKGAEEGYRNCVEIYKMLLRFCFPAVWQTRSLLRLGGGAKCRLFQLTRSL